MLGPDFGDCNGVASDGCETSLTTTSNCGSCGNDCQLVVANATPKCTAGACGVESCVPNFGGAKIAKDTLSLAEIL